MGPKGVMARADSRIGGYSRGQGGSIDTIVLQGEEIFYWCHGIVAGSFIGNGLAFFKSLPAEWTA